MAYQLEIALLVASSLAILFSLAASTVGVLVLLRTAAIHGLSAQVDLLADLVKRHQTRDARRQRARTSEPETDTAQADANTGADVEQRKATMFSEYLRRKA